MEGEVSLIVFFFFLFMREQRREREREREKERKKERKKDRKKEVKKSIYVVCWSRGVHPIQRHWVFLLQQNRVLEEEERRKNGLGLAAENIILGAIGHTTHPLTFFLNRPDSENEEVRVRPLIMTVATVDWVFLLDIYPM
jgi:hypothetical protein